MAIFNFRCTLALLLASSAATLLACGDDPVKQFAADAASDATTSTVVEVTVIRAAGPIAGATVVFQNADDSVVATKTTDAAGVASELMTAGGSITAIVPDGSKTQTYTILAVKPGDKLKIRELGENTGMVPVRVSVNLPPNSLGTYTVLSSCGTRYNGLRPNNGGDLDISVQPTCTQASFLVKQDATLGSGGTAAAAIYKTNVTLANGVFDLSDQTFTGLMVQNITGSNLPEIASLRTSVAPLLDGFVGKISESSATIMPPGFPTFAGTFQRVNATATKQVVTMDVSGPSGQQQFAALTNIGDATIDNATALTS